MLRTAAVLGGHRQAEQAHLAELAHDAWLGSELGIGVGLATWSGFGLGIWSGSGVGSGSRLGLVDRDASVEVTRSVRLDDVRLELLLRK